MGYDSRLDTPENSHMWALGWVAPWHEVQKEIWMVKIEFGQKSFLSPSFLSSHQQWQTEYTNGKPPDHIYKQNSDLYDLQERAQETSLISTNDACRKSDHFWLPSGDQLRKPNKSPVTTGSETARTWLVIDSFPNFCTHFQLRTNQEKAQYGPSQSQRRSCFYLPTCSLPRTKACS